MRFVIVLALLGFLGFASVEAGIRNGSFEIVITAKQDSPSIKRAIERGWEFSTPPIFPKFWRINPAYPGKLDVVKGIAHTGKYSIKLGGGGHLITTFGPVEKNSAYKCSVWAKGKGTLSLLFYQYGGKPGEPMKFLPPSSARGNIPIKNVPLKGNWTEYVGFYKPAAIVQRVNLVLSIQGEGYIDDVKVEKASILDVAIFDEMQNMKKTGRYLLMDSQVNMMRFERRLDKAKKNLAEIKPVLRDSSLKNKAELVRLMEEKINYLLDKENINRNDYNTATALQGISERLRKEFSFKDVSE